MDFIQFELHLPECTGLNAVSSNDNIKTCYSPPTGKTELNFLNIHDVTIRHNYCPAGWKSRITSGRDTTAKFSFETKDRVYMTCLLTDGRDNLQDMVLTSTDENNLMTWDGLFDLTRYSMGDGLIEGCGETHIFGPDLTYNDVSVSEVGKYHLTFMSRDTGRRTFSNNFSNITKGGYQVLNDNMKLLVHDSAIRWNMDVPGKTDADNNSFNSHYIPWTLSVQVDYDVKQIVYRQSLQQYISAKVKPEQKLISFLDADEAAGIPIVESIFRMF